MKTKTILTLAALLLAAVFSFNSCKEADIKIFTITVLVSEGVSGVPSAGTYLLEYGAKLQYSFTLNAGYSKLTVLWGGTDVQASGTLSIIGDQTLQAYADDDFQCALTVDVSNGVSGTPQKGTYNYPLGTVIDYQYALEDGYYDLMVFLDDEQAPSSGTIVLNENHRLNVSALAGKDVRGTWLLSELYQDESAFDVTATFSGSSTAGTVTDSDGGSGTYTFTGSQLAFNLVFPAVTYEYTGSFSDNDKMGGTCKRYLTAENAVSGVWRATRKAGATTAAVVDRVSKGEAGSGQKK